MDITIIQHKVEKPFATTSTFARFIRFKFDGRMF